MLCVIPARGGSRRILRKNIRLFFGKPIINYSIELARKTSLFTNIVVSTDDDEIAEVSKRAGANVFQRHSDDGARGTQEVAAEVIKALNYEGLACVIYPTAPLLEPMDLVRGLHAVQRTGILFAFGVCDSPLLDAGAFYWGRGWAFAGAPLVDVATSMVPLPASRVCDINTETDWRQCEQMFASLHGKCCGHVHQADAAGYCANCPDVKNAQMLNQRGNM